MKRLSAGQIAALHIQGKASVTASLIESARVLAEESEKNKVKYKGHTFTLVDHGSDHDTGAEHYSVSIDGKDIPATDDTSPDLALEKAERYIDDKKVKAEIAWDDHEAIVNDLAAALGEQFKDEIRDSLDLEKCRYCHSGEAAGFKADGTEYNVIKDYEEAERIAKEQVKQDLENEPELFTPSWLQQHLYITDTDRRLIAQESADSYVDDIDDDRAVDEAEMKDEYDAASDDEKESIVEQARENLKEKMSSAEEESLKDPIQYLVEEQGIYTMEQLMKASFIHVDTEAATDDAVETDGWAHFLSHYDGNYETTPGGMVYFRES